MKGLVKVNFTDKETRVGYLAGRTIELADFRMKEFARLGFVELAETKPEAEPIKAEPEKVEKAEKVEKLPTKKAPAKPKTKK